MKAKQLSVMHGGEMVHSITNREKGVLLLHGFLGSPYELKYLSRKIGDAGYSFYIPRYPGHGTTIEEMSRSNIDIWFTCAREAYLELKSECKEVYIAGLSMGALFAILLACEFDISKLALISMPAAIPDKSIYATPILRYFVKVLYDSEEKIKAAKRGINNPADRATHVSYFQGTPVAQVWQLHCMIKKAMKSLPFVKSDTLVMQSHGDEIIPPWSLDYVMKHLGTQKKQSAWFDKSNHVVCFDYDKDAIAERIINFLNGK